MTDSCREHPKKALDTSYILSYSGGSKNRYIHMKIAVIETGGKQYLVNEGSKLTIEKIIGAEAGKDVSFKTLLTDDGALTLGAPYLSEATASYDAEGRNKTINVVKYKAKSRYYKKRGHRQPHAKVTLKKI